MIRFAILCALLTVGTNLWADENLLRLYFMPSAPTKIEWDSPKNLLDSTISAVFNNRNHAISHVNVEIKCANPAYHALAGAVSQDRSHSSKLLFEEKIGFSIMATAWPGRLENLSEIHHSLEYRGQRKDMLSALTIKISAKTCARLAAYHEATVQSPHPRFYGFAARPRRHEGAGCSAFAASFLEVAGLLTPKIHEAWLRSVKVPRSLMTVLGSQSALSVNEILAHPDAHSWVSGPESHMNLSVYDPDLMHKWVDNLINDSAMRTKFNAEVDTTLNPHYAHIQALTINAETTATPEEPIFLGPPDLKETRPLVFIRSGLAIQPDGSFALTP